jgi:hypothetical protein
MSTAHGAGSFIPHMDGRNVEQTITALEATTAWKRQAVEAATGFTVAELRAAHMRGELSIRPCGDGCAMRTANTGNVYNDPAIWRKVKSHEPVLYYNGIAILLPHCGNPVACEEGCCVQVTARHQQELRNCLLNGRGGVICFN